MATKFTYKMRSVGKWDVGAGTRPTQTNKKIKNLSTGSLLISELVCPRDKCLHLHKVTTEPLTGWSSLSYLLYGFFTKVLLLPVWMVGPHQVQPHNCRNCLYNMLVFSELYILWLLPRFSSPCVDGWPLPGPTTQLP